MDNAETEKHIQDLNAQITVLKERLAESHENVQALTGELIKKNLAGATLFAEQAAEADKFDALAAEDAARIYTLKTLKYPGPVWTTDRSQLEHAYRWALEATKRDPANYAHARFAAYVAWQLRSHMPYKETALKHMSKAVELNPMEMRLRLVYARMLRQADRPAECLRQLRQVEKIDRLLLPGSVEHLSPEELKEIERLKIKAGPLGS